MPWTLKATMRTLRCQYIAKDGRVTERQHNLRHYCTFDFDQEVAQTLMPEDKLQIPKGTGITLIPISLRWSKGSMLVDELKNK